MRRALVVGSGGSWGGHDAGVLADLCRNLPKDYFSNGYGCSSGCFSLAYYFAHQPDEMEKVWRTLVTNHQLVNWLNRLRGREILDLEYLVHTLQSDPVRLDTEALFASPAKLIYVLTEAQTQKPTYFKPTPQLIFDLQRASAAIPFVHRPVRIGGSLYFDGGLVDPLPIRAALHDDFDEIVVVYNRPRDFHCSQETKIMASLAKFLPEPLSTLLKTRGERFQKIEEALESDSRIQVIRAKEKLPPRHTLDFDHQRVNKAIDIGMANARAFREQL